MGGESRIRPLHRHWHFVLSCLVATAPPPLTTTGETATWQSNRKAPSPTAYVRTQRKKAHPPRTEVHERWALRNRQAVLVETKRLLGEEK